MSRDSVDSREHLEMMERFAVGQEKAYRAPISGQMRWQHTNLVTKARSMLADTYKAIAQMYREAAEKEGPG